MRIRFVRLLALLARFLILVRRQRAVPLEKRPGAHRDLSGVWGMLPARESSPGR